MTVVVLVRGAICIPTFAENEDVGNPTHGIGEDGDGPQVYIRVVTWSLLGRGAVEIPYRQIFGLDLSALRDLGDGLKR
jgi:hypothetical protein